MMAECGGGGGGGGGVGGPRKKALSLLEAARSRYESLQISDDVFGESGQDSSGNPFYSTSADSRSSSAASSEDEDEPTTSSISSSSAAAPPPPPPPQPLAREVETAAEGPARGGGVCCFQGGGGHRVPRAGAATGGQRQLQQHQLPGPMDEEDEEERGGWTQTLRDTPPPRFEDTSGPTRKMPPSSSAMDFFQLFVPDNVLKNMVVQTNMYAKKYQERFGSDGAWAEVTLTEMKAFLGYMISTSIYHCESVLSIWSSGFYSNKSIALVMSQSRFEKILKYFHVVAFRSSQTTHGLYKIQPFLDSLQYGFDSAFRPSQTQVLHEPLIDEDPVFIATCTERELRKRKKRKFSLWVRQCSSTGFISQIYVHLKEGGGADGLDTLKNKPQLHSMVAKSLCRNAAGKNYIIFTGPSITSLPLFEEFEKQEIYCCGLLSSRKSDCTGLPLSMLNNSDVPQARGQYQIKMKGNMSVICWYNKGPFRFLTNAYSPVQQGVIIKRKSGEIPCPLAVEAFAAHLSYICKYDDKYSKYFISHKPNKTWQQVFWFAISIAINNAYILYKMSEAYHVKRYSRAQFGERLIKELLGLEDTSLSH
ncbi:piggyBac transposable element-derived protein 5 [Phascolarctos cinereus]|uniref:PiggyBac transposable element-derived protein 5 n=1 Tax=Phascolarctos cinereus TaxID=38626 RepID=A0A6P5LCP0_PHACI|nr:piggyBac transposable element-derived protein 5 [Phascolarctos cinereus]XP_020856091.1 piggyBac transposable element-derived protein 5 [Phascolarctos cinereus]